MSDFYGRRLTNAVGKQFMMQAYTKDLPIVQKIKNIIAAHLRLRAEEREASLRKRLVKPGDDVLGCVIHLLEEVPECCRCSLVVVGATQWNNLMEQLNGQWTVAKVPPLLGFDTECRIRGIDVYCAEGIDGVLLLYDTDMKVDFV